MIRPLNKSSKKFDEILPEQDDKSLVLFFYAYDRIKPILCAVMGGMTLDKHKTITIKINGEKRPHKDENLKQDHQSTVSEAKPKIKAWNETAAAKEPIEDSFDWVLPENGSEEGAKDFQVVTKPKQQRGFRLPGLPPNKNRRNSTRVFPRVAVNVLLAVVIGLGFGLMILKTINPDAVETVAPAVKEPAADQPAAGGGTESAELPAISTFVVQGGVYSSEQNATAAAKELVGNGVNAQAISVNGNFALLLGVTGSLEEAKAVGTELQGRVAEVFSKPLELEGFSVEGLTKEEISVLTIAPELFAVLSSGDQAKVDAVEEQLAKLKAVDESKLKNKDVIAAKQSLEQGAIAFLDNNQNVVQKESLAFLGSWQALGK